MATIKLAMLNQNIPPRFELAQGSSFPPSSKIVKEVKWSVYPLKQQKQQWISNHEMKIFKKTNQKSHQIDEPVCSKQLSTHSHEFVSVEKNDKQALVPTELLFVLLKHNLTGAAKFDNSFPSESIKVTSTTSKSMNPITWVSNT